MELLTHVQTVDTMQVLLSDFFWVPGNKATHIDAVVTAVTSIFTPYTKGGVELLRMLPYTIRSMGKMCMYILNRTNSQDTSLQCG